jgi:hypothetical protein
LLKTRITTPSAHFISKRLGSLKVSDSAATAQVL